MENTLETSGVIIIASGVVILAVYLLLVWTIRKWMIKRQVSCVWRSIFLALFLAPGLLIYAEHGAVPLPCFAWMAALNNIYGCASHPLYCSIKLNLFTIILPMIVTWIFAYTMCKSKKDAKYTPTLD